MRQLNNKYKMYDNVSIAINTFSDVTRNRNFNNCYLLVVIPLKRPENTDTLKLI